MKATTAIATMTILVSCFLTSATSATAGESCGDLINGPCGWCQAGRAITQPLDPTTLPPQFANATFEIFSTTRHIHGTCEEDDFGDCWPETECKMTVHVKLVVPPGVAVFNTFTGQCHAGGSMVTVTALNYASVELQCGSNGQPSIRDYKYAWGLGTCTGPWTWIADTTIRFWCYGCADDKPAPGDYGD